MGFIKKKPGCDQNSVFLGCKAYILDQIYIMRILKKIKFLPAQVVQNWA
jgi:hypothetical protein